MKVAAGYWYEEDVDAVQEMFDLPQITCKEKQAVLLLACVAEHNAELGVNWDVLHEWYNYIIQNPRVVEVMHNNYGKELV